MKRSAHLSINPTRMAVLVLMGLLVFVIYYNTLGNPPTNWDDPGLFNNPGAYQATAENLKRILTFQDGATFQPLRDLSYLIDFALWKSDPVLGMHLHNILLYYLLIIALWMFLMELFTAFDIEYRQAFRWATFASVIYAVHPVHVESVAWLYARKEPLLGLFSFLSCWAFVKARRGRSWYYALSIVLLALAILSQPTALVIPAAMLVIDLALQAHKPSSTFWKRRALVFIPMLVVVVPMMARLILMMSSVGGIKPYHGGNFWTNLLAVSQIFISYLGLIGFRLSYAADYPITLFTSLCQWQAWVFAALNVALIASALVAFLRGRYIYAIFVAWFYIFVAPVAHIFPIAQLMADRYALIPSLSWCVLLGFLLNKLWDKRLSLPRLSSDLPRLVALALISVIVLSYAALTIHQNTIWQSSERLWENTVARYPNSSPGNVNLAVIYIGQGKYQAAQDLCINAIMALPYDYLAISNLALAQMLMGQYDNAIQNYQMALKLKPDLDKARLGLANAYWEKRDYAMVLSAYTDILRLNPGMGNSPYGGLIMTRLGYASWKLGKATEAKAHFLKAAVYARQYPPGLKDLAEAYASMGETAMALRAYQDLLTHVSDASHERMIQTRMEALKQRFAGPRDDTQASPAPH